MLNHLLCFCLLSVAVQALSLPRLEGRPDQGACDAGTRPRNISLPETINSPNFPQAYPPNSLCEWRFLNVWSVEDMITFTINQFNIDPTLDCNEDGLEIYDGPEPVPAQLIGRYCGSAWPPDPITATAGAMFVRFYSNAAEQMVPGFEGRFGLQDTACGADRPKILTAPSGTFTSPGHPLNYEDNLRCAWLIQAQSGQIITLNINDVALELTCCSCDYISIYDGNSDSSPLLGTFCAEQIVPQLTSTQHHMYIYFFTDSSIYNTGFNANYNTVAS